MILIGSVLLLSLGCLQCTHAVGDQEPSDQEMLFKATWLPPLPGTSECVPPRPWMSNLKPVSEGRTIFSGVNNEDDYYFTKPQPDSNLTADENMRMLEWQEVDAKGAISSIALTPEAFQYLGRLGAQAKDFASVGPDVENVPVRVARRFLFGSDDRVRISCGNEVYFPTSVVGKVTSGCSGTLIGPRHVLTAGHCVHTGGKSGDWIGGIKFQPQLNCPDQKVSSYGFNRIFAVKGWTYYKNFEYDYALIELSSSPNVGWMSFGYSSSMNKNWGMNIRGYMSQDKPSYQIYNSYASKLKYVGSLRIKHTNDIVKGTSGAMMYLYDSGSRVIYGIQSHHSCPKSKVNAAGTKCSSSTGYNGATRITSDRFHQICGWINIPSIC